MVTERGRAPGSLTIRAGGWSLILGAVAFLAVFSYLAARFDYPAILDGPAATVLPLLPVSAPTSRSAARTRGAPSSRCNARSSPRSA
jgi:hypothetical protein